MAAAATSTSTSTPPPLPTPDPVAKRALDLIEKLVRDEKLGADVRKRAKEMFPDIDLPEDRVDPLLSPLREENKALKERLDKLEEDRAKERREREERDDRNNLEAALEAARSKYNLTDDGLRKVTERLLEKKNTDVEAAAAWVAQQTPPVRPPGPMFGPTTPKLFPENGDEKRKLLLKDPQAYMDAELEEFVRDPDAYVRAA